jgi:excisionase family DNA binding protein
MTNPKAGGTARAAFPGTSRLLTPSELAEMLGVPIATLYAWRYHGKGPPALRIGRHLRYPAEELRQWIGDRARGERRD